MSSNHAAPSRLAYLDGLRGVAILSVVGFHYFACFPTLVPYGALWADVPWFRWGYWGVHLFFGISGFVILMTLERSAGPVDFFVRRLARLWPTMLLCAALSYAVLTVLPSPWRPDPADFLPSLTFIDPAIWNKLVPGLESNWIDVAYWSLFVEVRFYFWAAVVWFLAPTRFIRNFFLLSTTVVAVYVAAQSMGQVARAEWLQWLFAAKFLPWFVIGIAARAAALGRVRTGWVGLGVAALQTALLLLRGDPHAQPVALILVAALLLGPLWWARLGTSLAHPVLVSVGAASYSLYLLHQYIGIALIDWVANVFALSGAAALPVGVGVGLGMAALARFVHRRWEAPSNDRLVRTLSFR